MSSCYLCSRSVASIRCLICQEYFCLTCSGTHRYNHLLDAFERRLNSRIHSSPIEFNENLSRQFRQANDQLKLWIDEIRRALERKVQYELEEFLRSQFQLLKGKTDEYVGEYVENLIHLRSNVHYAKERSMDFNDDHQLVRLISIEKDLERQFQEYSFQFRLKTSEIDFTKYIQIDKHFDQSTSSMSLDLNYRFNQAISLQSTIQHITSSCLDLFIFVVEPSPKYPRLLEFSTSSLQSKISLTHSIEFPLQTNLIDMCWSIELNSLLLLTPIYLHQYDKYKQKVNAKVLHIANTNNKWNRLTINRFGIYILNEENSIEFYDKEFSPNALFLMKDLIDDLCLIYDLDGHADSLCTLVYTKDNNWQINLFTNRQLDHQRTLKLSESFRSPLKLLSAHRRKTWIIIDSTNHRLIVVDNEMNNIEYFPLNVTPNGVAILDDQTLVVISPDIPGTRISFYSPSWFEEHQAEKFDSSFRT